MSVSTIRWSFGPARIEDGTIRAETVIAKEDPWFDGHFPGDPVLPAVAQLSLAWEAVRAVTPAAGIRGFRRVKFKEMIRPGQRLAVSAAGRGESGGAVSFKLYCDGRLACSGSLLLRPAKDDRGA